MLENIKDICLIIALAPLLGSLITGLSGKLWGRTACHRICIGLVFISFLFSLYLAKMILWDGVAPYHGIVYTWAESGSFKFNIGFLVDQLTVSMMVIVTFVSLLVHIFTIGYMADDDGYIRFFSYISLFTFAMLMLVSADNFLQLFFGWEGVGLVSYLLIGFWHTRESAVIGSLKAFVVNRVGDMGFLLGIAAILDSVGSLNYQTVFADIPNLLNQTVSILPGTHWSLVTVICICLFIGAMGKSAQIPLHVWLPESMEGPTPISALIHAATMVTAGVFLLARMSPLFEHSQVALSCALVLGSAGALFLGLVGIVQSDIKRVVAYSTLSQLGYMMAAQGASAFQAGMFHLFTHACFKALLFLAAGSVIVAMHHEQDMRKMGGLRKYMPITYITFLIGALSLAAIPPFSGFYSKDMIIEAVGQSTIPGSTFAYICVLLGAFVTALYIFRAFFFTFHGTERMDEKTKSHLKESHWTITFPLIALSIPSVLLGYFLVKPMLFAKSVSSSFFGKSIFVLPKYDVLAKLAPHFHGPGSLALHALITPGFWLAIAGIATAYVCYVYKPELPKIISTKFNFVYKILVNKLGFDSFNDKVIVKSTRGLANLFYHTGDVKILDNLFVNGSGRAIDKISRFARRSQSGFLYHYVFAMLLGVFCLLVWLVY